MSFYFQSHVPDCVDHDPAIPKREFKDLDELLASEWIQKWKKDKTNFSYCWSENKGKWSKAVLMAEWKENGKRVWWVLGYLDYIPRELPEWKYK